MTNPYLKAAFLDIFESVGYPKKRLKERLNKFKELENELKSTDYTFSENTKLHVEILEKLTNDEVVKLDGNDLIKIQKIVNKEFGIKLNEIK